MRTAKDKVKLTSAVSLCRVAAISVKARRLIVRFLIRHFSALSKPISPDGFSTAIRVLPPCCWPAKNIKARKFASLVADPWRAKEEEARAEVLKNGVAEEYEIE